MNEQVARMRAGEWYLDVDELRELRRGCWLLLERYNSGGPDDDRMRSQLLSELLGEVGPGAIVMPRFQCSYGRNIHLGKAAFVNSNAFLMDDAVITIGAHARIGPGAQLMTALHPVDDHRMRREGWERAAPVTIGENAWLGAGVTVGPGVSIGRNAVIGAGSTVLKDVPDHVVAAGSPAVVVRETATESGGPA